MRVTTTFKKFMLLPLSVMAAFILASCGSYDYVSYDNDGIYGSTERGTVYTQDEPAENDNYYTNYFAEKSAQYSSIPEENAIFIDIESYSSANSELAQEDVYLDPETTYNGGHGSWGDNTNSVSINYYNSGFGGFYNPYFNRFRFGYGYNHFGNGFGFYGNGFYSTVGFGFYSPFFGGFHNPYYFPGFYGGGFAPFYNYNPFYTSYNYRNSFAFHNGRRSAYTAYRTETASNEGGNRYNRDGYSRNNNLRRNRSSDGYNRNSVNANRRSINRSNSTNRSRATRSSGNSNRSIYRTNRSSNNRSYNSSGSRRSSSGVRRSSGSSTNSGVRRSSGGSSRSSGVRRSGGSSRSSGTSRSGGGRGRG